MIECNRHERDVTGHDTGFEGSASRSNVRFDFTVAAARLHFWSVLDSTALGDADATKGDTTELN